MLAGAEAVKMATEDRFDITEWFKMIKVLRIACRSSIGLLQQYRLHRVHTVILCSRYYSIAVYTTLPMPNLLYALTDQWAVCLYR